MTKTNDYQLPAIQTGLRWNLVAWLTVLLLLLSCFAGHAAVAPLKPEEAFRFKAVVKGDTIEAIWTAAEDYYLYRDRISFASGTPEVELGEPVYPVGKLKHGLKPDGSEGEVETYSDTVTIVVPITKSVPGSFTFIARAQGCAEKLGLCYPPQTREQILVLAPPGRPATGAEGPADTTSRSAMLGNIIRSLMLAFLSGFGLSATPCVLPMLPIISSIIAGQSENMTRARGGLLTAVYVLGTAMVWSAAGVLAGSTGEQLQAYTSHPYFLLPAAGVLVLLSLAMFGVYDLQMPMVLQSRAQARASGIQGGTFAGVFLMGILSSVIAGACVSPILILNLGAALDSRNPVLGGAIMFMMALGMGLPMILLGIGAGWLLPKAGVWMNTVKHAFGVVMVGLALTIVSTIPWMPVLYLWAPFLGIVGVYMVVRQARSQGSGWRYLWKAAGTLAIVWGIFALVGALQGNRNILRPVQLSIASITGGTDPMHDSVAEVELFERVHDVKEMAAKFAEAKAAGKPVFLDYYAPWCTDCKIMEKKVFNDSEVRAFLQAHFVVIQADLADQFDKRTQPMKDKFNVFGPPAMLFFDRDGNMVKKVYGLLAKDEFVELARATAESAASMP